MPLYQHQKLGEVGLLRLPAAQLDDLFGEKDSCAQRVAAAAAESRIPPAGADLRVLILNQTPRHRLWHPGQTAASYVQAKILLALLGANMSGWAVPVGGTLNDRMSRFCEDDLHFRASANALKAAHLIITNPEGTLHSRTPSTSAPGVVRLLDMLNRSTSIGKPLWIQNAMLHPCDQIGIKAENPKCGSKSMPFLHQTAAIFSRAKWLVARDDLSRFWMEHGGVPSERIDGPAIDTVALLPWKFNDEARARIGELHHLRQQTIRPPAASLVVIHVCSTAGSRSYRSMLEQAFLRLVSTEKSLHVIDYLPPGMHCFGESLHLPSLDTKLRQHNGSHHTFSHPASSWAEVVYLFSKADVVVSGSFHALLFARLAAVPCLATQGNTFKAAELVKEIASTAYRFLSHLQRVRMTSKEFATILRSLANTDRSALKNDGVMERLRQKAMANVAPLQLSDCIDVDDLLPTVASLDVMREHEDFQRGCGVIHSLFESNRTRMADANNMKRNGHKRNEFEWMGWKCDAC